MQIRNPQFTRWSFGIARHCVFRAFQILRIQWFKVIWSHFRITNRDVISIHALGWMSKSKNQYVGFYGYYNTSPSITSFCYFVLIWPEWDLRHGCSNSLLHFFNWSNQIESSIISFCWKLCSITCIILFNEKLLYSKMYKLFKPCPKL